MIQLGFGWSYLHGTPKFGEYTLFSAEKRAERLSEFFDVPHLVVYVGLDPHCLTVVCADVTIIAV